MENYTVKEGKSTAIIAYLWWIGLIVAVVMNSPKKNAFAAFHIRQMIGLIICHIGAGLIGSYVNGTLGWILGVGVFVLWLIGFLGAIQGEEKKVPLLGEQFQEWFRNIQ